MHYVHMGQVEKKLQLEAQGVCAASNTGLCSSGLRATSSENIDRTMRSSGYFTHLLVLLGSSSSTSATATPSAVGELAFAETPIFLRTLQISLCGREG